MPPTGWAIVLGGVPAYIVSEWFKEPARRLRGSHVRGGFDHWRSLVDSVCGCRSLGTG